MKQKRSSDPSLRKNNEDFNINHIKCILCLCFLNFSIFILPIRVEALNIKDCIEENYIYVFETTLNYNNSINFIVPREKEVVIFNHDLRFDCDVIVEDKGKLIINNSKITFFIDNCFEHGITLKEDAVLHIINSEIKGFNNLFFFNVYNSTLLLQDSRIKATHILCGNESKITVMRSQFWALQCFNKSTVEIFNSNLNYLFLRGDSSAVIEDSNIVEVLLYDNSTALISSSELNTLFCFDKGYVTLTNCSYIDIIRFDPILCNLKIVFVDEETEEPIPGVKVLLNHSRGKTTIFSTTGSYGTVIFIDLEDGDYIIQGEAEGYETLKIHVTLLDQTQYLILPMNRLEKGRTQTGLGFFIYSLAMLAIALLILHAICPREFLGSFTSRIITNPEKYQSKILSEPE